MSSERLAGKVALVTGGASGLGADQVRGLLTEGARVVFGDIQDAAGAELQGELRGSGLVATYTRLDVTQEEDWRRAITLTLAEHGRLDVLVNNAGIVLPRNRIEERTVEEWDRVMAVNVRGVFLGIKHAIPAMRAGGGGSIVNISSLAALGQAQIQEPAYAASKGAVTVLTKVAATQHAHENIRCNSLHPGPTDGGMLRKTFAPDPAAIAKRLERVPMGRLARVEEIVAGVIFLASDEAAFMTGAELVIDGGATVQ
jgi:3alpha(or 20beta)-hydroxysteroid dehydrogenase